MTLRSGNISSTDTGEFLRPVFAEKGGESELTRLSLSISRLISDQPDQKDPSTINDLLFPTYDSILHVWAHVLELRDIETLEHTNRVTTLSVRLAKSMGLSGEALLHMARGALLHDIGKLGIPDRILLKEGPLTTKERGLIQQHPVFAYLMLSPIEFLHPALDIPLFHHEKWDGTGYPYGLAGEQIPLDARIFAIVDVWDALNSSRPYRPEPWPREKIILYLKEQSGRHFDPEVTDRFLNLLGLNGKGDHAGSSRR